VTLRKQKNKEMKRLKRALFSRDADATAHCKEMETEVTESAGITTVFREHYKQLGSHWC
jgi:hypothetical protein